MSQHDSITGQCLCGSIAFRVKASAMSPLQVCHCSQCRKAQGGPFATNVPVEAAGVEFVQGKPLLKGFESSPGKTRFFCSTCGSPVFSVRDTVPGVLRMRAGLFDEDIPVRAAFHAHVGSRAPWWPLPDDGLSRFDKAADLVAAAKREANGKAKLTVDVVGIDHVYLTVTDLARAEAFYDRVMLQVLGHRKNTFTLNGDAHIQYYNRHFGLVLRPARSDRAHDSYAAGLHHFCLRVDSIDDVKRTAQMMQAAGIEATAAANYPQYAPDYWATFFEDPDGIRLEVTNYRQERRARHDQWDTLSASP